MSEDRDTADARLLLHAALDGELDAASLVALERKIAASPQLAAEFESLQTLLRVQRLSVGTHRSHVDWNHLSNLRKKHDSITRMITWLNDCLDSQQPVWQRDA